MDLVLFGGAVNDTAANVFGRRGRGIEVLRRSHFEEAAMWRRSSGLAMAVVLGAAAGACSSAVENRSGNAFAGETAATVMVSNENWHDMRVYAVRSGMRVRLGTVTSMSTQQFRLPGGLLGGSGDLRVVADPIGSQYGYRSQPLLVRRGQQIEINLRNNLALSTTSVW